MPHIEFVSAIFGFYDMSLVASPGRLRRHDLGEQSVALCRTVEGRFIQALLDLDDRRLNLLGKYRALRENVQAAKPDNPSRIRLKSADVA
jgi:hypothetical protein